MPIPDRKRYLAEVLDMLAKTWPDNKTVQIVCHGHSVPAGYKTPPLLDPFHAYPHYLHRLIKERYQFGALNMIVTAVGGENAVRGAARFTGEVLCHKPDVLLLDYALNDRYVSLEASEAAWRRMMEDGLAAGCKILLATPSWDRSYFRQDDMWRSLMEHDRQVRRLAEEYGVGLMDFFAVFTQYVERGGDAEDLLCADDHPSRKGHQLLAQEAARWFPCR